MPSRWAGRRTGDLIGKFAKRQGADRLVFGLVPDGDAVRARVPPAAQASVDDVEFGTDEPVRMLDAAPEIKHLGVRGGELDAEIVQHGVQYQPGSATERSRNSAMSRRPCLWAVG